MVLMKLIDGPVQFTDCEGITNTNFAVHYVNPATVAAVSTPTDSNGIPLPEDITGCKTILTFHTSVVSIRFRNLTPEQVAEALTPLNTGEYKKRFS